MSHTRHIGLIANDSKTRARTIVQALVRDFTGHDIHLHLDQRSSRLIGAEGGCTEEELAEKCELLIVLGGDGTILQVLHALGNQLRPFFGINLGSLGFLTTVAGAEHPRAISAILSREYTFSERTLLQVDVIRDGETITRRVALNDAVASRGEVSRLMRLAVKIDGNSLTEYNADGLIVATPTGSTAYSLSAGGPIVAANSGVFVVNPICPHVLTNRAVVVCDDSLIEIAPVRSGGTYLTIDGQDAQHVREDESIRITKAPYRLQLASLPGVSYFDVLRQKLKWSGTVLS